MSPMALPSFLKIHGDVVRLNARLQPRASKDGIGDVVGDALKIKVTAPPVDFAANEALIRLLAGVLKCPKSDIHLVRGRTSRMKTLEIRGLSAEIIAERFENA